MKKCSTRTRAEELGSVVRGGAGSAAVFTSDRWERDRLTVAMRSKTPVPSLNTCWYSSRQSTMYRFLVGVLVVVAAAADVCLAEVEQMDGEAGNIGDSVI